MDLLSISVRCKDKSMLEEDMEHSFRDRGTYRQASEGSCFQNGELSGDGLKRCCGGRRSILFGTEVPTKGRQARAAAFKMGRELSGDGLKRCCGGQASRILRHH